MSELSDNADGSSSDDGRIKAVALPSDTPAVTASISAAMLRSSSRSNSSSSNTFPNDERGGDNTANCSIANNRLLLSPPLPTGMNVLPLEELGSSTVKSIWATPPAARLASTETLSEECSPPESNSPKSSESPSSGLQPTAGLLPNSSHPSSWLQSSASSPNSKVSSLSVSKSISGIIQPIKPPPETSTTGFPLLSRKFRNKKSVSSESGSWPLEPQPSVPPGHRSHQGIIQRKESQRSFGSASEVVVGTGGCGKVAAPNDETKLVSTGSEAVTSESRSFATSSDTVSNNGCRAFGSSKVIAASASRFFGGASEGIASSSFRSFDGDSDSIATSKNHVHCHLRSASVGGKSAAVVGDTAVSGDFYNNTSRNFTQSPARSGSANCATTSCINNNNKHVGNSVNNISDNCISFNNVNNHSIKMPPNYSSPTPAQNSALSNSSEGVVDRTNKAAAKWSSKTSQEIITGFYASTDDLDNTSASLTASARTGSNVTGSCDDVLDDKGRGCCREPCSTQPYQSSHCSVDSCGHEQCTGECRQADQTTCFLPTNTTANNSSITTDPPPLVNFQQQHHHPQFTMGSRQTPAMMQFQRSCSIDHCSVAVNQSSNNNGNPRRKFLDRDSRHRQQSSDFLYYYKKSEHHQTPHYTTRQHQRNFSNAPSYTSEDHVKSDPNFPQSGEFGDYHLEYYPHQKSRCSGAATVEVVTAEVMVVGPSSIQDTPMVVPSSPPDEAPRPKKKCSFVSCMSKFYAR